MSKGGERLFVLAAALELDASPPVAVGMAAPGLGGSGGVRLALHVRCSERGAARTHGWADSAAAVVADAEAVFGGAAHLLRADRAHGAKRQSRQPLGRPWREQRVRDGAVRATVRADCENCATR
ncbi:MAG TPA: hypothetical protein PLZ50_11010, partial [Rubrivivax sp.]|nr:hypothetical protein [Rubrivivax sp.]